MNNLKTTKEIIDEVSRLQRAATDLVVLLETTYAVMPDDALEQEASYRYLVGMAHRMADELQEQLDRLNIKLYHLPRERP